MRFVTLIAITLSLSFVAPAPSRAQQLQCSPCSLSFGNVVVGSSASSSIKLTNTGSAPLNIVYERKQGHAFSVAKLALPFTLRPGASVGLPVTFAPQAAGTSAGRITLSSTAKVHWLHVDLSGTGVSAAAATLTVIPATLNFGSVPVGSTSSLLATITAVNGDVTISSDQLTSSEFSIQGLNLPLTIPSGQSIQTTVQFAPNQSGTASGKVGYFSNAIGSPTVEQFSGTGVAQTSHSADLTWQENDPSVVGYNVYRGTTHGGPYQQINTALDPATNYTDSTVAAGLTYYYVTTAVDGSGRQSAYSNETAATIPSP